MTRTNADLESGGGRPEPESDTDRLGSGPDTDRPGPGPEAERADLAYAFAVGLYAAVLLGPAVVLAASPWLESAAGLYVALLASVTGVAAAATLAATRAPGLAVRLGRRTAAWLLVVAPLAWFAGGSGAAAVGVEPPDVAGLLAILGTAGGMLLGIVVVAMSRTRYADAATAGATELAAWTARWPKRWRQAAVVVVLASVVVGAAGMLAEYQFGVDGAATAYTLTLLVLPVVAGMDGPRTFRATSAGLVVERPHQRQFRPWTAYSGYELTEDALVVHPAARWRPAHRCDRADVEDVPAVVDALDRALRGPGRGG